MNAMAYVGFDMRYCECDEADEWRPGRMYDHGHIVKVGAVLFRGLRASWNVYPRSITGREYWLEIGSMGEHALMKKILGLDQASNITGVCRVRCCKGNRPWYDTELFRTPEREGELLVRYARFLIDELATDFDLVVIERPIIKHANGAVQFEIIGLIRYFCQLQQVPLLILPPKSVKMWATGSGDASKADMVASALIAFDKVRLSEDEADAAWIANIGFHVANGIIPSEAHRARVLARAFLSAGARRMQREEERRAIEGRKAARKAAREAREAQKELIARARGTRPRAVKRDTGGGYADR